MEYYKKTQYGVLIIFICILTTTFIFSLEGLSEEFLLTFMVMAFVLSLFGMLTISIDRTFFKIKMGIGLFGRKIKLKDIKEVKVTKIPWWLGSGVRYYRGRWIYNVAGFQAVEITQIDNKSILVGTAEPTFLKKKIDTARSF